MEEEEEEEGQERREQKIVGSVEKINEYIYIVVKGEKKVQRANFVTVQSEISCFHYSRMCPC